MNKGKLYIISAPSGAGKTSLVKQLVKDLKQLIVSVSHTTRKIREGEQQDRDYFFSTTEEFKQMIADNAFLEHAQVFDHFYGTAKKSVEDTLKNGLDVILEIDWQGAQQVRKMLPTSVSIFILPPSIAVLQRRLESRGQDSKKIIERRMRDAVEEMRHYSEFDYLIVNDSFDQALTDIKNIIFSYRLEKNRQLITLAPLLDQLIISGESHHN